MTSLRSDILRKGKNCGCKLQISLHGLIHDSRIVFSKAEAVWLVKMTYNGSPSLSCKFKCTMQVTEGYFNCQTCQTCQTRSQLCQKPCTPIAPITTSSIELFV